jgi:hypothetical protein
MKISYITSHYAECRDIFFVLLNAIILNVVMLNVVMLNVIVLNVVMLNVVMLNVVMMYLFMLNVIILNAILLNVIMLNVVILNVVRLNVVAPYEQVKKSAHVCMAQFLPYSQMVNSKLVSNRSVDAIVVYCLIYLLSIGSFRCGK